MKLIDRQPIEGTVPVVYIGHRPYRSKQGLEGVSKTWYAEYSLHGEAKYEALHERNKQAAMRAVFRMLDRLERGEQKPVTRRVEWTELQDKYMEFQTNRNRGPKTLNKYAYGLKSLVAFAELRHIAAPAKFTASDFWGFAKHLRDSGNEGKTVFDRLMFTKQVFKWAWVKAKMLAENPLAGESVDEPPPKEQPCYTDEQVRLLLEKASPADRPVFALMAYTGMRFGEVRDLRWSDLHLDRGKFGQVFVKRGGSLNTTKGKANRIIPIHPELRKVLDALPRRGELIFYEPPQTVRGTTDPVPLKERKLLARLKRTCKVCEFANPKRYKLHTFRHAFASMCARQNTSYKYALAWMGHKSSDILDLYYKMFDEVADQAMAKISYEPTKSQENVA